MKLLLATLALLIPCAAAAQTPQQKLLNHPAPPFQLSSLDHHPVSLAGLKGHVVLLNFWASWCTPCVKEMPLFNQWLQLYSPKNLAVLGISVDDSPADALRAATRLRIQYPIAMGSTQLATSYGGVLGVPITYLIDRHGILRARFEGETDPTLIQHKLDELLKQQ